MFDHNALETYMPSPSRPHCWPTDHNPNWVPISVSYCHFLDTSVSVRVVIWLWWNHSPYFHVFQYSFTLGYECCIWGCSDIISICLATSVTWTVNVSRSRHNVSYLVTFKWERNKVTLKI